MNRMDTPPKQPVSDAREHAARLLVTSSALVELSLEDARVVLSFMKPSRVRAGSVFIEEGETVHTDYMVLLLDGDVRVDTGATSPRDGTVMTVIGPGSLIGEMGIIDGGPRSATCTAVTDLLVAVLSRDALKRLINDHPQVASRLILAIAKRLSDRLRETNRKFKTLSQVSRALQQELDATHAVNQRLLG
jgi:CRP-like cAMP-binding protein